MIRPGFLTSEEREDLLVVARDGSLVHRLARRANAVVLLDRGMSCEDVSAVLLLDDDTIRTWYRWFERGGISGLAGFGHEGSTCRLSIDQQERLKSWITETLPRTTREVGAWIVRECGPDRAYQSRSGLVALLHRLGMEHRKPRAVSARLDEAEQRAFIDGYNALLNGLPGDEAVMFADAVHPTHLARPVGCWAPKDCKLGLDQSTGRKRLNIHGAIDLESGQTRMLDVPKVNAMSTIALLRSIERLHPAKRWVHVFVDNAKCHHARLVRAWLARPERRVKLHFIPAYSPHLNPIERLWRLMHRNLTHNKCYANFNGFCDAILDFLRQKVPKHWNTMCDEVTDNFRVISPKDFRVLT